MTALVQVVLLVRFDNGRIRGRRVLWRRDTPCGINPRWLVGHGRGKWPKGASNDGGNVDYDGDS